MSQLKHYNIVLGKLEIHSQLARLLLDKLLIDLHAELICSSQDIPKLRPNLDGNISFN